MRFVGLTGGLAVLILATGCADHVPPDEALQRVRAAGGAYADLGADSSPEEWEKAARQDYPPAYLDYFEDMDAIGATERPGAEPLALEPEQVIGRNAWVLWTGGNQAWWDWAARNGYGSIDFLKVIDHRGRDTRFARTGLINEPGTRPPTPEETEQQYGIRYARPVTEPTPGHEVHVEYRKDRGDDWHPPDPDVYGYPTGVVGLRLFRNPHFDTAAERNWDPELYYADSEEGRRYAADPRTIRPYRVGISCGFCHIAPHPLQPPADPEFPQWENLSNNVGNQFMRMRAAFGNTLEPDNYFYHVFDSLLPGAVDTSGYPSDNNNNPNTVNSFYGLRGRLERARHTPLERLSPDSLAYVRTYTDEGGANPRHLPRVLLDGSDSVGVHIALARVYLNIGTHHQQWIRTINPLLGFYPQTPFKLRDVAENSLYWHAIRIRVRPMAAFFLVSTDPMRLKDIQLPEKAGKPQEETQRALLEEHLRGTGLPWYTAPDGDNDEGDASETGPPLVGLAELDYSKGRQIFARGCIACHSSVQPGDLLALERQIDPEGGSDELPPLGALPPEDWVGTRAEWEELEEEALAGRRRLRLSHEDRRRLTRVHGQLPDAYAEWARRAVERKEFWEHQARVWDEHGDPVLDDDGRQQRVTVHNYMSIDERLPVTIPRTNSGRATATNALHGHVWEDFASQTYKELGAVGPISYRDPFSGAMKTYEPPGGGPGYYRVPTLISIWATSPLFHNNALGLFNNDPSVEGRLAVFDDAIERLLWPEQRREPSEQAYWPGDGAATTVYDAWYPGKAAAEPVSQPGRPGASDRRAAAAQREQDGGWVWRTTEESWLMFHAAHVPQLVGGAVGLTPAQMRLVAWVPSLAFVLVGVTLLLSGPLIATRGSLERKLPWLEWLFGPVRWVFAVGGLALAAFLSYKVIDYWPAVTLLDMGTEGSIPFLRAQAVFIPVLLFGSVGLIFFLHRLPAGWIRNLASRTAGAACLVLAVLLGLGIGRTLAGRGADIRLGPIPEGTPVNIIANLDPEAPKRAKFQALGAMTEFLVNHHAEALADTSPAAKERRRVTFEEDVAPALLRVSKSPDFVTDRGHDYVFIRNLTDEEKRELIALLKTF